MPWEHLGDMAFVPINSGEGGVTYEAKVSISHNFNAGVPWGLKKKHSKGPVGAKRLRKAVLEIELISITFSQFSCSNLERNECTFLHQG